MPTEMEAEVKDKTLSILFSAVSTGLSSGA